MELSIAMHHTRKGVVTNHRSDRHVRWGPGGRVFKFQNWPLVDCEFQLSIRPILKFERPTPELALPTVPQAVAVESGDLRDGLGDALPVDVGQNRVQRSRFRWISLRMAFMGHHPLPFDPPLHF